MLTTLALAFPLLGAPGHLALTAPVAPRVAAPQVETAKEGESGHRYPVTTSSTAKKDAPKDTQAKTLDLLGMGIREKYWIAVNVYSYALYVDHEFVVSDLKAWKGKKSKTVEKDEAVFSKLLTAENGPTRELRLRFCRKVDAEDVVSAFEDSLEPRILEKLKDAKGTKAQKLADLTVFRGFFTLDKLKSGNELRFTWHPDGTLSTVINGERQPDVKSPSLCWALFDVYMGKDPISKSGKKKLVRRLVEILAKVEAKPAAKK